jgi:hypothetical protein
MDIGKYKQAMSYLLNSNATLKTFTLNPDAKLIDNDPQPILGFENGRRVNFAEGTQPNYNALSNEDRVALARKRVVDFVEKFKKENDRLPSQQEIRKQGKFDFATVKKAIESKSVEVLPLNQTKGEFTKIPVNNDLKILDQNKIIKDAFKSGEFPSLENIQKVLKIKDPTTAANRISQLASVYSGDSNVEGIKPKFQKTAKEMLINNPYESHIRDMYEKTIAKSVGEKRTPSSIRTTTQRDIIPNIKGYSIDEPAGVTSSVRRGTTPYGVFSQIIDSDINKGDKYSFDSIKAKKEKILQNAIATGDKTEINKALKDFNKIVSYYENKLNTDIGPGEKKIKLFKASLDSPENTIKNFDKLPKQYQEAFINNFADRGYSYQVPKDIKTVYEIGEDLKNPKIAEDVAKRAAKGQARIYSEFLPGTQVITSSVGDYLKDLAVDVKAGKVVSPFLKVLAPVGTALGTYDVYENLKEGKPLAQSALAFVGADPLAQSYREQSRLSPESKEIQKKIRTEDIYKNESFVPGLDVAPPAMEEATDQEKIKLQKEQEKILSDLEKEENITAEDRKKLFDYILNRINPIQKEEVNLAKGGRIRKND